MDRNKQSIYSDWYYPPWFQAFTEGLGMDPPQMRGTTVFNELGWSVNGHAANLPKEATES